MRIVVDCRPLTSRPTGVAQYLMAAINVWSDINSSFEFILLAHKPLHPDVIGALKTSKNITYVICPAPIFKLNGLLWFIFWFPFMAIRWRGDCIWGPCGMLPPFYSKKLIGLLTVNDLVFRAMPSSMSARTRFAYGLLSGNSIKTADLIWAISNFTAKQIDHYYPKRRANHIVVGCGLNPLRTSYKNSESTLLEIKQLFEVTDRTLLFVGTLEPRKNLQFLLSLMKNLSIDGYKLLIVGCSGWGKSNVESIINDPVFPKKSVIFCDFVSDDTLQALYETVPFFISTSLMEGFGLPQLEAMAVGCPVIAAANSAVTEVVGTGGVLVEGWDTDLWCQKIRNAHKDREILSASAKVQAKKFSIEDACSEISEILNLCLLKNG
jgi:glycosyltransferase involved in cell wall biosynthesis